MNNALATEADRSVATRGIHNFRDFGRYAVAGGGHLVANRLFRSGEHKAATPADLDLMHDLGIRTFVDLRGLREREKAPCRRREPFDGRVIWGDGETAEMAPHAEAAQALDAVAARRTFQTRYRTIALRPVLVDVFRRYVQMLADSDDASVIYCSAGKDRTGVVVGLLQAWLGVHHDDVVADYLLTNESGDSAARVDALRQDLTKRFGPLSDEAIRVVTTVEPSFLEAAFDAVREQNGSIERYFDQVLQAGPELRERIASRLIG